MIYRIIPVLLVCRGRLVKTIRFEGSTYVGDPVNAIRIFNEKGADEITVLDIGASRYDTGPDRQLIARMAAECFMPLCYGGGISKLEDARMLFQLGIEKLMLNTALRSGCIKQIAEHFGSQSIAYSLDVRRTASGDLRAFGHHGSQDLGSALACAQEAVAQGAGEIVLHMIDRDGTMGGYDLDAVAEIAPSIPVPMVALGGAGCLEDFNRALRTGASAVAAGSMFVFIGRLRAVLISYPDETERFGVLK